MRGERMAKRSSFGSLVRKKLSDITNSQTAKLIGQDEKPPENAPTDKDYIDQLMRERMTLLRLVAERNKIIELSGAELQKLRVSVQKLQLQNLNLAQSNSQMLAELNLGREKVKKLQHEVLCKDALLKAKNLEKEGKAKMQCQNTASELKEEEEEDLHKADNDDKPCNYSKRRSTRSRSMGPSTTCQKVDHKEKVENKRRCLRRQSARFKSHEKEQTENLFEIEDAKFPVGHTLDNPMANDGPTPSISSIRKQEKEDSFTTSRSEGVPQRSSIGRPLRKAAVKVQSYKEVPLNVKMRREE